MNKRILLGLAAAAAVAVATSTPASAHYEVKLCGPPTAPHYCVCVYEGPVDYCTP